MEDLKGKVVELRPQYKCSSGCAPATRCSLPLNRFCHSLSDQDNSQLFRKEPEKYCRRYALSLTELEAVTDLDVIRLLELGANATCMEHLTAVYQLSVAMLGAQQTGLSEDDFRRKYQG